MTAANQTTTRPGPDHPPHSSPLGGYEGLTAYAIIESTGPEATLSGIIFPTAMPEVPEPYAAE